MVCHMSALGQKRTCAVHQAMSAEELRSAVGYSVAVEITKLDQLQRRAQSPRRRDRTDNMRGHLVPL